MVEGIVVLHPGTSNNLNHLKAGKQNPQVQHKIKAYLILPHLFFFFFFCFSISIESIASTQPPDSARRSFPEKPPLPRLKPCLWVGVPCALFEKGIFKVRRGWAHSIHSCLLWRPAASGNCFHSGLYLGMYFFFFISGSKHETKSQGMETFRFSATLQHSVQWRCHRQIDFHDNLLLYFSEQTVLMSNLLRNKTKIGEVAATNT